MSKNRSKPQEEIGCRNRSRQLFDEALEQRLGYTFRDPNLLRQALTHPSMGQPHNQRLEFLGDAVLELCASQSLYAHQPALVEGEMTRIRAALVNEHALTQKAEAIALGGYILMSPECENDGGRERPSILSNALEAMIGAIFLDGGLEAASALFGRLWLPIDLKTIRPVDDKSALQEWLQARGRDVPNYRVVAQEGPAHLRTYLVEVLVEDRVMGTASGSSKKRAEQDAARQALSRLKRPEDA